MININLEKKKVIKIIGGIFVVGLIFLAGMEFKAYQMRSALNDAFGDIFSEDVDSKTVKNTETKITNDLTKKVGLEITKKGFSSGDFIEYNTFTFKLTNTTDKNIQGVKGAIIVNDLFGDQITGFTFSYDEGVNTGESKLYNVVLDYNQFINEDIKLKQTALSKINYEYQIQTIIYTDGSEENF